MDKALPFPTEQERRNFFWTKKTPRPTAETYPYVSPPLSEVQSIWDASDKKVREHEAHVAQQVAEREAQAKAVADKREAEFAEREAKKAEDLEAMTKARYLAAGNSADDWERDREAVLRNEAMKRLDGYQDESLISREQMLR